MTGADDEASDLDLLVDPTKTTSLFTLAGFKADAEDLLGIAVSVLTPEALPPKFRSRGLATGAASVKHPERVEDYLGHIAEAIARATSYVEQLPDIEAFRQNPLVQDGVVRNIEIIGEAANHIARTAPDFITQHPELPWRQMRSMRNIVIHAYFHVDLTVVWGTVQNDLPPLKQQIDQLLGQHPPNRHPINSRNPPLPMKVLAHCRWGAATETHTTTES